MIISKGKLVACDTPENLERLFAGTTTVELVAEASGQEVREILSALPCITGLELREDRADRCAVRIETDRGAGDDVCRDVFWAFSKAGHAILQMTMAKASLEDIFMELTSGSAPQEEAPEQEEEREEEEE